MATPQHRIGRKRRTRESRARLGVFAGVVLFVLAQAGLGTLIEGWRPELRNPTFEIKYRQLVRLLKQHSRPTATVVFLGSSMTANGVDASISESPLTSVLGRPVVSYNFGINHDGPLAQLLHVQCLLRRGIRPELVCLEVAPLMYDARENAIDSARFPAHILDRHDLDTLERFGGRPDLSADWWQARLVPIHGHRIMILNQSAEALVPFNERAPLWHDADAHGWRPVPAPAAPERRVILEAIEKEFRARWASHRLGENPVKALRELTDLLARERIVTMLVVMPEGPLMRSLYSPEMADPALKEFTAVSQKHGFQLVDARDWFDEVKFRDSYHLTREGATAFTERLLRESLRPTMARLRDAQSIKYAAAH